MAEGCGRRFDEALLSGYVDGTLTQGDEQRVRVHLEDCAECRAQVQEMTHLREVTMNSKFEVPPDDQWSETPRGGLSLASFGAGWVLVALWLVASIGYGLWEYARSDAGVVWKLISFAGVSGLALLLVSVLVDRLKTLKRDRYMEVKK